MSTTPPPPGSGMRGTWNMRMCFPTVLLGVPVITELVH